MVPIHSEPPTDYEAENRELDSAVRKCSNAGLDPSNTQEKARPC
jgi:hypothetical protein